LTVIVTPNVTTSVTVGTGVAVDSTGKQLVLATSYQQDMLPFKGKSVYVTIRYHEFPTDPSDAGGVRGDTRIEELPQIGGSERAPDDPTVVLLLARVAVNGDGVVTGVDNTVRHFAGVVGGDLQATSLTVTGGQPATSWSSLTLTPGDARRKAALTVSTDLQV